MHAMKPPDRWISQIICLINIWQNIFQFSLCRGLVSSHATPVPVEICPSWFSSSDCLKRPSTWSLSRTEGLKSFSAISCNRWSFWYQVASPVHTLTRICSINLLLFPPAGPTKPVCWSCLARCSVRLLSHWLPLPPFPDFINETSKNALFSCACLIPPH